MGRREELEKQLELAQQRIDQADPQTPREILHLWNKELNSIACELNNLYDDLDIQD